MWIPLVAYTDTIDAPDIPDQSVHSMQSLLSANVIEAVERREGAHLEIAELGLVDALAVGAGELAENVARLGPVGAQRDVVLVGAVLAVVVAVADLPAQDAALVVALEPVLAAALVGAHLGLTAGQKITKREIGPRSVSVTRSRTGGHLEGRPIASTIATAVSSFKVSEHPHESILGLTVKIDKLDRVENELLSRFFH